MPLVSGLFTDSRTGAKRRVLVDVSPRGLEIRSTDGLLLAFWAQSELRPLPGLANNRRHRLMGCAGDPHARLIFEIPKPQPARPEPVPAPPAPPAEVPAPPAEVKEYDRRWLIAAWIGTVAALCLYARPLGNDETRRRADTPRPP